jgi:DNA polymerase-1
LRPEKFLIVDGSSLLVRAYFATAYPGRPVKRNSNGVYTNGVLGFFNMLFKLVEQIRPTHLCVAWDVSRDTFRRELYPAYKGTRGELPDELHPQFETTKDVLAAMGIWQHLDERFEADDIIGTVAMTAASQGHRVLILTGDRDALQLVRDNITVAIMKKGISEMAFYTPELLAEEWGLSAEQIVDLKGLMGDSSDNIPGVPGIGEKTAKKLLAEHHNIENLIANRHTLGERLSRLLTQHQDIALLSKRLATIVTDVPLHLDLDRCALDIQFESAREKFMQLELDKVLTQLERLITAG